MRRLRPFRVTTVGVALAQMGVRGYPWSRSFAARRAEAHLAASATCSWTPRESEVSMRRGGPTTP
jgi:hypothetical protein